MTDNEAYVMALCQVKDAILDNRVQNLIQMLDLINIGLINSKNGILQLNED